MWETGFYGSKVTGGGSPPFDSSIYSFNLANEWMNRLVNWWILAKNTQKTKYAKADVVSFLQSVSDAVR
jgi:hypothetical protein